MFHFLSNLLDFAVNKMHKRIERCIGVSNFMNDSEISHRAKHSMKDRSAKIIHVFQILNQSPIIIQRRETNKILDNDWNHLMDFYIPFVEVEWCLRLLLIYLWWFLILKMKERETKLMAWIRSNVIILFWNYIIFN